MTKQQMINELRDIANNINKYSKDNIHNALKLIADDYTNEPNPIQDIVKLNEERYGLSFDMNKEIKKLEEELNEMKEAAKNNDLNEFLDGALDVCVVAIGSIRKAGYDPEKALNEVVKEITSREQDPVQAKRWANGEKEDGEKWLKDTSQDKSELYKANFENCKIEG